MSRIALVSLMSVAALSGCGNGEASEAAGASQAPGGDGGAVMEDEFELEWSISGDSVTVTMSAPTTGWVAVGFHSEGAMKNAQIVIGYVDGSGPVVRDDFGTDYTTHRADTDLGGTADVAAVSGVESGGRTTLVFRMPLDSGDQKDRVLAAGQQCAAILAYGGDDDDSFTGYHAWTGSRMIEL
jgi:hypothetical protein